MPLISDKYSSVFGAPSTNDRGMFALIADEDVNEKIDLVIPILWQAGQLARAPVSAIELSLCGLALVQAPIREGAFLGLS